MIAYTPRSDSHEYKSMYESFQVNVYHTVTKHPWNSLIWNQKWTLSYMELWPLFAIVSSFTLILYILFFLVALHLELLNAFTPHIKDLSDDSGCIVPSVFLASIENQKNHLHTKSASWFANKSFGTGSSGASEQQLPAYLLKFLRAHCVLASVLSGTTPLPTFSCSGDDTGFEKHCSFSCSSTEQLVQSFNGIRSWFLVVMAIRPLEQQWQFSRFLIHSTSFTLWKWASFTLFWLQSTGDF